MMDSSLEVTAPGPASRGRLLLQLQRRVNLLAHAVSILGGAVLVLIVLVSWLLAR